jgi:tetratricopeptide (TPR) repeat protein
MTDHLIQRRAPDGLTAMFRERPPEEYRGPIVPYYPAPLPASPLNALYLAIAQVGLGNNTAAGLPSLSREIAAQRPTHPEFYVVLGDASLGAGKTREAIAAYRQAAQLDPKSPRILRRLARALERDGQTTEASQMLQRAIEIAPADPLTWQQAGMLEGSAEKLRKAVELDPTLPDQSRMLAELLLKAGQPDGALAAVRNALRVDPYDESAWDLAGRVLAEKGDWAGSFYDFEKALRLRPGDATFLYDYALALVRADRFDEAQQRAEAAVAADANSADAHELLGGLYLRKGRLEDAVRAYRRLVELRPDARARQRLADAQRRLGAAK